MNPVRKLYCRIFQTAFRIAIPLMPYRRPKTLESVEDVPGVLKGLGVERALIVTDPGVVKLGLTKHLEAALTAGGIKYALFGETVPNPTTKTVGAAIDVYRANGCRAIIAVGGGSSMDCAKAVGILAVHPGKKLARFKGILKVWKKLPPLIAIPTTAGTGSETTLAAIITDANTRHKYAINSFPLIPHYAVLDPEMTVSLPPSLTASTGLDALTHAVEAYIGRSTTRQTRADALEAVRLIFGNLDRAWSNGGDVEARRSMLRAAYCAGCAFTVSYVGYVHAVAHSLGGEYDVPHGYANAVLLPIVLRAYGSKIHRKLAELTRAAGIYKTGMTDAQAAEAFISAIEAMKRRFGIGDTIAKLRKVDIRKLSKYADSEGNPLYPVPVLMDARELEKFYEVLVEEREPTTEIHNIVEKQRAYFQTGATLDVEFRRGALDRLADAIRAREAEIAEALRADLGKGTTESFICETGLVLSELGHMKRHLRRYARARTVPTPLTNFHSRSFKKPSPHGTVLIMSPWNYPFLLAVDPLVDAIAAGNTAVVKPSAYSPRTSAVIAEMLRECFDEEYVAVVTGGREENTSLLGEHFDYIFFTGSKAVGHEVMRAAAEHLTPVTLELGGKSPCIIEKTANLKMAARRIVFGKYLNCGQTCVAPDYIYCDAGIKDAFLAELKREIARQYGAEPLKNADYGRIVNEKHFDRLTGLLDSGKLAHGGAHDRASLRIEPTVLDNVSFDDPVMQQEIFGPILPIVTFEKLEDAVEKVKSLPHPLALYIFTSDKRLANGVIERCGFGGGCINDVVIHLATSDMGFGGFGESGMGAYHGKDGFDTFSHYKSIVDKKTWIDLPMRYQPYTKLNEKLIRMFLK